jgi:hypothetical protein
MEARGYNWANLFLEDINTETWAPGWGSLKSETANVVMSPVGLGPKNEYAGEGQQQL